MTAVEPAVASWAERIRPHLAQAVESIVAAGHELIEAKGALPHGQFGPLLDELGLSPDMAQRFMRVARSPALNAAPARCLPPAVTVLAELTRLDEDQLREAIEAGEVTAATTRAEAAALVTDEDRRAAIAELDAAVAAAGNDPVARYRALDQMAEHFEEMAAMKRHLAYVQRHLADALKAARGVEWSDEERELLHDSVLRARDLAWDVEAKFRPPKPHEPGSMAAAVTRNRDGLVRVFRKYEGMTTDAGDTVTAETFAEHAGIPVDTFRRWLDPDNPSSP